MRGAPHDVCFCYERSHKMRLGDRGSPSPKVKPWPPNRYRTCARRQQAALCDLQGMNVRDLALEPAGRVPEVDVTLEIEPELR